MPNDYSKRLAARRRLKLQRDTKKKAIGIMPTLISCSLTPDSPTWSTLVALTGSVSDTIVKQLGTGELELKFSVSNDFVTNEYVYYKPEDKEQPARVFPAFVIEAGEMLSVTLVKGGPVHIAAAFYADSTLLNVYANIDEVMADAKPTNTGTVPTGPEE